MFCLKVYDGIWSLFVGSLVPSISYFEGFVTVFFTLQKLKRVEGDYGRSPATEMDLKWTPQLSAADRLEVNVKFETPWQPDNEIPGSQTWLPEQNQILQVCVFLAHLQQTN